MKRSTRLRIRLHGPFALWWDDGEEITLRGNKAAALMAMLVAAPDHKRTRAWLQEQLWGRSGAEHGRASLRQCLSAIKKTLGNNAYEAIFHTTNDSIGIRSEGFQLVGGPQDGVFLEGVEIASSGFINWLAEQRARPNPTPAQIERVAASPKSEIIIPASETPRERPAGSERLLPVVAVIPFSGVGGDEGSAHFGDAIAQDVTRSLSRSPYLMVISHLSSRSDRLRNAEIHELRKLLKADYIITGNVRLADGNFRLDVDFVDTASGQLCWTRSFNGKVSHFFNGGEEVVHEVADTIMNALFRDSLAPLATSHLPDIETHRLMTAAITLLHRQAKSSFGTARECLQEVINRAPRHALPHAWFAKWHIKNIKQGWSTSVANDLQIATDSSARALECNPVCPFSLVINGFVRHHTFRFDRAFEYHEEALSHDPNHSLAWLLTGVLHTFMGNGAAAVENTEKARILSPLDPHQYFYDSMAAGAHAVNGDYDAALKLTERSLRQNRRYASTLRVRAFTLEMVGRHQEACVTANEIMQVEPDFTIAKYRATHPSSNYSTGSLWGEVLHRTGIPMN